jgi:agmatinase
LTTALDKLGARPLYLTLDLDILDPSQLPGTGTPEPGGITWQQLEGLLGCFSSRRLIAADVVELAPDLDPTGRSAVIAAKAVRSIALLLARARGFVAGNHA